MPPKFGNYLFRNLKGQSAGPDPERKASDEVTILEQRPIVLQEADFLPAPQDLPTLRWSQIPESQITVRLGDTTGLMEGRVRISGRTLHELYPGLLPELSVADAEYPVLLKTVVLQVQAYLSESNPEAVKASGADFDTPIAQVAREDEGSSNWTGVRLRRRRPLSSLLSQENQQIRLIFR
jgi:hypothetical protein